MGNGEADRLVKEMQSMVGSLFNPELDQLKSVPFLIQYVKVPYSFSPGFFNMKKMLAAANGKLLDKKGNIVTAAEFIKSSIEIRKVGYLVAFQDSDGTILIGWAQWYKSDEYEPAFGVGVAVERALKYKNKVPKRIPFKVAEALPNFVGRATAYFKTGKMVDWVYMPINQKDKS